MDMRAQISKQTTFALSLTRHLSSTLASDRNLAFSPASLHVILALIAAGAKGPTLDQILHFLRSDGAGELASLASEVVGVVLADVADGGGPMVRFANGVWVDSSVGLKPSFKEVVGTGFQAEAKGVDFQAKAVEVANEVNSWVENVTAGLIKELLPSGSVNSNTRLVFANALYFKGAWEQKFDPSKTKESDFFLLDGTLVKVQFMTSKEKQFLSSYDGFSVLRLPYKQGNDKRQFSMYIFLPHAKDGLWNLSEKLSSESEFLDRLLPRQKVSVGKFKIPKFKISFGFEATEVLKGLGLALPFSQDGDLTEMVDDSAVGRNLFVSSIFHKSFIEVNEEGTEAAAATAAVVMMRSIQLSTPDFEADHPFAFVIREDMTGVVMFTGHILNPLLSE